MAFQLRISNFLAGGDAMWCTIICKNNKLVSFLANLSSITIQIVCFVTVNIKLVQDLWLIGDRQAADGYSVLQEFRFTNNAVNQNSPGTA